MAAEESSIGLSSIGSGKLLFILFLRQKTKNNVAAMIESTSETATTVIVMILVQLLLLGFYVGKLVKVGTVLVKFCTGKTTGGKGGFTKSVELVKQG